MLESLTLRNFQPHEKLTIKLDPHVTTIVGPSDHGKSSVLRALKWAVTNRPVGEAFVRRGAEITKVSITVDGREIRRTKGRGHNAKNSYHLDGSPLKAFGTDVPEGVAKLLNTNDTNFQKQYDAPFWFSESAGVVSRSLNQIINLGIIDDTLAALGAAQRTAGTNVATKEQQLATAETDWQNLKNVKTMNRELKMVEEAWQTAANSRATATLVEEALKYAMQYGEQEKNTRAAWTNGLAVVVAGEAWQQACSRRDNLARLCGEAEKYTILANTTIPDIGPLEAASAKKHTLTARWEGLSALIIEYTHLQTKRYNAERDMDEAKVEFETQLGERCPLCKQKVNG